VDLVCSADFYAGGFGARYPGRTSSVLDVRLRDGNPTRYRAMASASPFIAEVLAEGPAGTGVAWLASARRSLVEETSGTLLGATEPLAFESQLLKVTTTNGNNEAAPSSASAPPTAGARPGGAAVASPGTTCSGRALHRSSSASCVAEVNFSFSHNASSAVSRGSSGSARDHHVQHDAHATSMIGSTPSTPATRSSSS
jgi:hypothetical protein